ncbi:MAG TPA: amidohydrolase [Candidatus Methylomirabilis sp.]|nr:amidohydrolase [Candidatus Methylomirabilis sp.]
MSLVIRGGTIATPYGDGVRSGPGTITVDGDRIARVAWGPEADRVTTTPADRVIDARTAVVIPGLVDAHSHCYGSLIPGLIDRLPLDVRRPFLAVCTDGWTERDTRAAVLLAAWRMLRSGTTTVNENSAQGLDAVEPSIRALLQSGMRAVVSAMVADRPVADTMPGYLDRLPDPLRRQVLDAPASPPARELVERSLAIARRWHGAEGRVSVCLSPWAPYGCSDRLLELVGDASRAHSLTVHTHLLETRAQAAAARRLYGTSMVEHIAALGLLSERFSAAHAVWLSDRDLDLLADSGAAISHNPLSNLYLGSGIARVPELLRRGVPVGIGSDGPNCGSTASLFEVMKLAALVHRLREPAAARWVSPDQAFRMATIGGARALNLEREIGSIEEGKKADLVLLDAGAPELVPLNDPIWQLVYGESGSAVTTVIVDGEVVLENGRPTRLDTALLRREAEEVGRGLAEHGRTALARISPLEPYLNEAYRALLREFDEGGSPS